MKLPLLWIAITGCAVVAGDDGGQAVHEAFQLREFQSYASVAFTQYQIPEGTAWALWRFMLMTERPSCAARNATVYLQRGGLPVFRALGETAAPHTAPDQYDTVLQLNTANVIHQSIDYFYTRPPPGQWFSGSYLVPRDGPRSITQQGFGTECRYFLKTSIVYDGDVQSEVIQTGIVQMLPVLRVKILRFYISRHVYAYDVNVTSCSSQSSEPDNSTCSFALYSNGVYSPTPASPHSRQCRLPDQRSSDPADAAEACTLTLDSVEVNAWHYLAIVPDQSNSTIKLTLSILPRKCQAAPSTALCSVEELYPIVIPFTPYTANFAPISALEKHVTLYEDAVRLSSFGIQALVHSGGSLLYHLTVTRGTLDQLVRVYSCVKYRQLTIDADAVKNCSIATDSTVDAGAGQREVSYYIPYPQEGTYYAHVALECYDRRNASRVIPCVSTVTAALNVSLSPCYNKTCGPYGTCYYYYSGVIHWSVCKCIAGYRGLACTDDTHALSDALQLAETLFLTLSNLMFIGSIVVALYRKWFSEALIYGFTLFASSFYHACDNGTTYSLCIASYSILQYFDFFGSIMAVWVTAMAMAEVPFRLRAFFHLVGFLGILIGTQFTLTGLWTFAAPVIIAAVILSTSWARICVLDGRCFPEKKVWLHQYLPGSLCALVGLLLYFVFETESNYYYTHSLWHMLMALAVVFLLPRTEALKWKAAREYVCRFRRRTRRQSASDMRQAENSVTPIVSASAGDQAERSSHSTADADP